MSRLAPDTVLGDTYRIVRRIGSGGMGDVYEATHARLAGRYAVKVLLRPAAAQPEALERFRREAKITSGLRHPNIVQVIDFNETTEGDPYLVMELLEGADLEQRIAARGALPLADAVDVIEQVAAALDAAHRRSIVHRDLNPQNIYLIPVAGRVGDFVKLLDFGISKIRPVTRDLTHPTTVMGTPQYMSPEQALGQNEQIDAATDQFALGAIAYEMLSGRPAFQGDSLQAILYQVVHEEPRPLAEAGAPRDIPARVEAVIRKALSKRPGDRFASVLELADELVAAVPERTAARRASASRRARVRARAREAYQRIARTVTATLRVRPPRPRQETVTLVSKGGAEAVESLASITRRWVRGGGRGRTLATGALALAFGLAIAIGARRGGGDATAVSFLASFAPLVVPLPAPERAPPPVVASAAPAAEDAPALAAGAPSVAATKKARRPKERAEGDEENIEVAGAPERPAELCSLTVGSRPWTEVWIDGTPTRQHTPLADVELPCGPHQLRFKRDELQIDRVEVVTLRAGEAFKRSFDLRGEPE